jgi:hypothetical protein
MQAFKIGKLGIGDGLPNFAMLLAAANASHCPSQQIARALGGLGAGNMRSRTQSKQ